MITKKALLGAICDLEKDFATLAIKVHELEKKVKKPCCSKTCKKADTPKRKPGRPRKNS